MKRLILSFSVIIYSIVLSAQQPLSLQDCRRMALDFSETMKTADNAVRQAELDEQIAKASYLPKIDGSITSVFMKDQDVLGMSLQTRGAYLAGINLTLPLYVGGQLTAANHLARISKEVSKEQLRQNRMRLIADVDQAYYQLIAVQSKVQLTEALERQLQSLYDKVALSVRAEMATDNELLRISAKQSEVNYQLQKARNGEQLCQLVLANLIGTDFNQTVIPTDTLLSTVLTPLSEDISNRPEVFLLSKQIEAKQAQLKIAHSNFLPTLALVGGWSHYGNLKMKGAISNLDGTPIHIDHTFSGGNPMAMLQLSVPLFHWGAEFKKAKKAVIDIENARLQQQQAERGMRIEVRQAVQNVTNGYRMIETAQLAQQQADENLRQMRQKYDNQIATMTDLLEAQSLWQQAHSNYIEAQTQYKIYETEYLRVTGRLE